MRSAAKVWVMSENDEGAARQWRDREVRRVGVEEELLLVDPTRAACVRWRSGR